MRRNRSSHWTPYLEQGRSARASSRDRTTWAVATICLSLAWPTSARAQVTLVLRAGGEPSRAIEVAMDDTLRDVLGGSVRRVDPTLDELALAAGCAVPAAEAPCVATVAHAASARAVALASASREVDEWHVTLDLRRADGTRIRDLSVRCADATECRDALATAFGGGIPAEPSDVASPAPTTRPRVRRTAAPAPSAPEPAALDPVLEPAPLVAATAETPVAAFVLLGSAGLAGVGAAIAGGLAVSYAGDAAALGIVQSEPDVGAVHGLGDAHAIALGTGIALALTGAGLAVAGLVTLSEGRHARARVLGSATGAAASIAFDF